MAYTPKKAANPARPANTSETTFATVGAGKQWIVKQVVIANTTATAATASVSLVPSGGSAGDDNRILKDVSIPANSVFTMDLAQVLNTGDFISIKQGTSSACAFHVSVVEFD